MRTIRLAKHSELALLRATMFFQKTAEWILNEFEYSSNGKWKRFNDVYIYMYNDQ